MLGWPHVDAGDGWLIFRTGPSELGVHPLMGGLEHHEISLMCDDLDATMAELGARGAQFESVLEARFGRTARVRVPGAGWILVYEPAHAEAHSL